MHREGAITSGDVVCKLTVLRIACDKCGRQSEHELKHLIERHGPFGKIGEWSKMAMVDCPRRMSMNDHDPCGAICPDPSYAV
jgi:hypothetical protein